MLPYLSHYLLSYGLPLALGFGAGVIARQFIHHWSANVAVVFVAIAASIVLQYVGFLIVSGWMTGSWPTSLDFGQLAYALMWFSIPAVFTCVPAAIAGFVCGNVMRLAAPRTCVAQ
jgi:hypothetical protein